MSRSLFAVCLAIVVLALGACTTRPTQEPVSKFAVAMEQSLVAVESGLLTVAHAEVKAEDEKLARTIVSQERGASIPQLGATRITINEELIQPRIKIFRALGAYATALSTAAGNQETEAFRQHVDAAGRSLKDFNASTAQFGIDRSDDEATSGVATAAVREFGVFLIDLKLDSEIPTIVDDAHQNVERLVAVIEDDLGAPDSVEGGLREILNISRREIATARRGAIGQIYNDPATSRLAVYELVLRSQEDLRLLDQLDASLAAIPPALQKMLMAHAALRTPASDDTNGQIEIFVERAHDLKRRFEAVTASLQG